MGSAPNTVRAKTSHTLALFSTALTPVCIGGGAPGTHMSGSFLQLQQKQASPTDHAKPAQCAVGGTRLDSHCNWSAAKYGSQAWQTGHTF